MKSKISIAALATVLAAALTLGGAVTANAETVQTVTTTPVFDSTVVDADAAAIAAYKAAKAEYRAALVAYRAAKANYKLQKTAYKLLMVELRPTLRAYAIAKKVIGQTFRNAIQAAKVTYQAAIAGVTDAETLLSAKNAFDAAKATAIANRAAALAALGPAPVKPAEPVKPTKPVKPTRQ